MNDILDFLRLEGGRTQILPLWEVVLAVLVTLACSTAIALVYRYTHATAGYSKSFTQTLVLNALVTCVIMIVVGSNLARAFSLLGALSIIRFRNAIKETRDVGFLFFSMAMTMAAGTRFYLVALVATGLICCVALLHHAIDFGAMPDAMERLLKVRLPANSDPLVVLKPPFETLFGSYALISAESVQQGLFLDCTFTVALKPGVTIARIMETIHPVNDNLKVDYYHGAGAEEV